MAITPQQRAALGNFKRRLHALGMAIDDMLIEARISTSRECDSIPDVDLEEIEITQELITDSFALAAAISNALSADRGAGKLTFQVVLDKAREL